ncbi:UDP-glucuronosyltransferase 2A2-like [Puntigrus tetrazona]|uniref:UDP-glucuronosyltransferase 2A2-like n=1 Tax=Puntigrus tetrazona TaxID=1606681 RepID=UPI001C896316|nr:UDP-glucuronosyltransferase 2A2-like [Puntigrus tetrazona]XP_043083909.1 UDP-glucuronosyltransferase 2A2-like [Puntigrus tetrazona]XP_043083910.1 UDP-glucuronosyltransferase 2A2-like [Puntigrus tetrazona]XP_043083911.1 UDP-glucuronosyltransferase 2A2-like [Puntigrus tetrazona]
MHDSTFLGLIILLSTLSSSYAGKILVVPVEGSHWINMKILIGELHANGHNITVVRGSSSWYIEEQSPLYTSITVDTGKFDDDFLETFLPHILKMQRQGRSLWNEIALADKVSEKVAEFHQQICNMTAAMFENKTLMHSLEDAAYDLVLTDPAFGGGVLLAHHLGLPLVLNVRWTVYGEAHFDIAPSPLSYVPVAGLQLTDKMTFSQRVTNVLTYIMTLYKSSKYFGSPYQEVCQKYFGPDVDFFSLLQNADIWLMRNDFTFEFPRPTMPNVVYMGGFQCKPAKPLPDKLEKFVQSSGEHGVIIMTLGTVFGQLLSEINDEIAAAFAQLPQKVIWRHTGPKPANLGNNTLIVDWLPQNDLLGHPQIKAFVAHGGTNGVQEAIYHGVPIVGLPLAFDQPDNLSRMQAKGTAKIVDIATLDRTVFLEALKEVLHNPSYKENMQRLSKLHHDQPMKPLDRAIFWIEFVMRNRGAPHLRTQSFRMSWIEYHSIDVILTLLMAVVLFCFMVYSIIKFLCFKVVFKKKMKAE